jgi:chorismate mutase
MKVWKWTSLSDSQTQYFTDEEIWQSYLENIQSKRPWRAEETRPRLLDQMQFPLVQRLLNIVALPIDNIRGIQAVVAERNEAAQQVATLKQRLHELELERTWDEFERTSLTNRVFDEACRLLNLNSEDIEASARTIFDSYIATGRTAKLEHIDIIRPKFITHPNDD